MFPLSARLREIEARWASLQCNVSFPVLKEYVQARSLTPQNQRTYRASFAVRDADTFWHRDIRSIKAEQVAALEMAAAMCAAATLKVPHSKAALIDGINAQCRIFDGLVAVEAKIVQKRRNDRVKGGKARQARLRPAREHALRLFDSMCPPDGWKNIATAARAIAPQVEAFVTRHRLSVFAGDSTIRTIRGWLLAAQRRV